MNTDKPTLRTTIARKLLTLFTALCLTFFAIIGVAVWYLNEVGAELRVLAEAQVAALTESERIQSAIFHQQQIIDNFLASPTGAANAAAGFREAGAGAAALVANTESARNFRELIEACTAKEARHGHLSREESAALDPTPLVEAYAGFQANAAAVLERAGEGGQGAVSADHSAFDDAADRLVAGIQEIDRIILDFVKEDAAELLAEQSRFTLVMAIASVVVFVLALVVVTRIVSKITTPITALTNLANRIADGDLGGTGERFPTGDEIEVLANAFDEMGRNLRGQIEEIRKGSELLSAAISEIGASIQEQAASAKEEAATIQEITTTMQEIQQSGAEISQRAKEVSSGAESTLDAGEAGLDAVRKTAESMDRIRDQVEEVAEKIVGLSEKTQAIGEIVATVNEIAEQSNILAINASIEAASAGESGSRFAVVAQEMKHLADQAKTSTKMVRGILEEIQKGINTSVMLTEEAVKRTDSGRAQSGLAQDNIHKLAGQIRGSVQTFQQIIAGTGQQQIGINQVVQGMQDIKQAVQQTVAGISQLEQATRSLGDMGSNLRASVARYKL